MSRWSKVERLPFGPLAMLVSGSDDTLGRRLRLSTERLARARELGLTVWTADRLAALAGFHPLEVWGFEWAWAMDRELAGDVSVFERSDDGDLCHRSEVA